MVNPPKKVNTEPSPPPDVSVLHAPTSKGWGKTEWTQWSKGFEAQIDKLPYDHKFEIYDRRNEAVQWAAPEEITVKISIEEEVIDANDESATVTAPKKNDDEKTAAAASSSSAATKSSPSKIYTKSHEIVLSKRGNDTFRSILDKYCQEDNIERDNYHWGHKGASMPHLSHDLLNQTDVKCFFDLWHIHPLSYPDLSMKIHSCPRLWGGAKRHLQNQANHHLRI